MAVDYNLNGDISFNNSLKFAVENASYVMYQGLDMSVSLSISFTYYDSLLDSSGHLF